MVCLQNKSVSEKQAGIDLDAKWAIDRPTESSINPTAWEPLAFLRVLEVRLAFPGTHIVIQESPKEYEASMTQSGYYVKYIPPGGVACSCLFQPQQVRSPSVSVAQEWLQPAAMSV